MRNLTSDAARQKLTNYSQMVTGWGSIPNFDERNIILRGLERILADPELQEMHPSAEDLKQRISGRRARRSDNIEPLVRPQATIAPGAAPQQTGTVYGTSYFRGRDTQRFYEPPFAVGSVVQVIEAGYAISDHLYGTGPRKLFARNGPVKVFIDNAAGNLTEGWSGSVRILGSSGSNPWIYNAIPLETLASGIK